MKYVSALSTLVFLSVLSLSATAETPKCPIPGNWTLAPEFSDEFNGSKLDAQKWISYNPNSQGRKPGWYSPDNVTIKEGMLQLTTRTENRPNLPEGYHTFTTALVKSKERVLYGYFEIRFRAMDSRASSAFWFNAIEPDHLTEIDVFEISGRHPKLASTYFMTLHVFRTPQEGKKRFSSGETWIAPYKFADGFHTAGLLWTKEKIEWYVDGDLKRTKENTHWHQPLNVIFDSETMPEWFGLPDPAELPSTFSIDYIRYWKSK